MPRESSLHRKLLGDRADWTLTDVLLARLDFRLAGANWQRSGGKGQKPKPLKIPDGKRGPKQPDNGMEPETAQRLRNLGLAAPGDAPPRPDGPWVGHPNGLTDE